MTDILDIIAQNVSTLSGWLWGWPLITLLLGTHLYFTFRLRFIQRHIITAIKLSFVDDEDSPGDISHFDALTTALSATLGAGHIVGVALAIAVGGPGAVFWLWITGIFSMATKYAEALLALKYRVKTASGAMAGGPMYVLERGLGKKWLAVLFCIVAALAAFGLGNMVQANSAAALLEESLHISPYVSGALMAVLTALVLLGGIKSISSVCRTLVPMMGVFYVGGCLVLLIFNAEHLPYAIELICSSAFEPRAALGGALGAGMLAAARYGMARGLLSNEAGLGSSPIAAAAARSRNPVRQALVASTAVFWDTVIVCLMSGLVLVVALVTDPTISSMQGAQLCNAAFAQIPIIGPIILAFSLFTFVFSTIFGWSYYGEKALEYLFGRIPVSLYRGVWVLAVFVGAIAPLPLVWDVADLLNALLALPNILSLWLLSSVIMSETRKYLWEPGGLERDAEEK